MIWSGRKRKKAEALASEWLAEVKRKVDERGFDAIDDVMAETARSRGFAKLTAEDICGLPLDAKYSIQLYLDFPYSLEDESNCAVLAEHVEEWRSANWQGPPSSSDDDLYEGGLGLWRVAGTVVYVYGIYRRSTRHLNLSFKVVYPPGSDLE